MSLDRSFTKDLSRDAVNKAVLSQSVQSPLTLYSASAAMMGGAYSLLISPNPIALTAVAVGGLVGVGNWAWHCLVQRDAHANRFVQNYLAELSNKRAESLRALTRELEGSDSGQALKQIDSFNAKYKNFVDVLKNKFDPSELTYNRYLSIAEQVFLGGIDALEDAAAALKSVSAIDVKHIEESIQELTGDSSPQARAHMEALQARLEVRDQQLQRVQSLLLSNEQALTELDVVAAKIASIDTKQGQSRIDLEDAMSELQRLIQRAEKYSNKTTQ